MYNIKQTKYFIDKIELKIVKENAGELQGYWGKAREFYWELIKAEYQLMPCLKTVMPYIGKHKDTMEIQNEVKSAV